MQMVLSDSLWKHIRALARKARRRKAAIAYVTSELLPFRKGDLLIVDASDGAVRSGETSARVLAHLERKGVSLYSCPNLHAKVLLLDDVAVIGSGNMSLSSSETMVEAALATDQLPTVSGIRSFIAQLADQAEPLSHKTIARLRRIKVVRRGGHGGRRGGVPAKLRPLGNRTWLVGVRELPSDAFPGEQEEIERGEARAKKRMTSPRNNLAWVRWTGNSRFVRECKEGDTLLRIWQTRGKNPTVVRRPCSVVLKNPERTCTRFFIEESSGRKRSELTFGTFKRLMAEIGFNQRIGPKSGRLLDQEIADAIERKWKGMRL